MSALDEVRIVPRPRAPIYTSDGGGAIFRSEQQKEFALARGAQSVAERHPLSRKFQEGFSTDVPAWEDCAAALEWFRADENKSAVKDLERRAQDDYAAYWKHRIKEICGRSTHPGEKLPEPPADEPILIRRAMVPPEGLFLEEAVDKVPTVNRCLNIKALNIASVPLRVMRRQGGKNADGPAEVDIDSPEARSFVRLLERPNAHQSGSDLIEAISFWMNTRQCLLWMMWPKRELTTFEESQKTPPVALYCLPAHRTVLFLNGATPLYYRLNSAGMSIPAWQVIKIGFYNPKEELRSISPLSACFQTADTDYAIDLFHANFFENGTRLSGIVSTKGQVGEEARARYESLFKQYAGVGNAHTVMFMDSDAQFTPTVPTMRDMEFKELRADNKDRMSMAFGVPPTMLSSVERGGKVASVVARKGFWQDTLQPEARKIEDKLNVHLAPTFGDQDMFLEWDWSRVEALSEDRVDFAAALNNTALAISQLVQAQVLTIQDSADLLKEHFDVEANGEKIDDPYEDEEEIMAESVSVAIVRELKNTVLGRLKFDPTLGIELVPVKKTAKFLVKKKMPVKQAQSFAERLAKTIEAMGRDTEKIAAYFEAVESSIREMKRETTNAAASNKK